MMPSSGSGIGRPDSTSRPQENPGANGKIALYSLILYKWSPEKPIQLATAFDLSSFPFFHRSTMKEHIVFHSRLICARTPLGRRQVVEFEQNIGHCHVFVHSSGLAATVLSTAAYPMRVAFGLITQALRGFQDIYAGQWENITDDVKEGIMFNKEASDLLKLYQNPVEADKLLKVQRDLDEVKDVMLKNIDDLLQRGEKLDDLMQRSEDLSNTSYQFYRQAKKNNQCCQLY
ncbi:SNARE protein [Toxoplasma gondii TgCatPRC2]|uniref:SNARE protein n=13 Tax=Toxoplasma gondii TaxID=5811 RepID=S7UQR6_TOXGG|nr:SNARE protein [Toxoplasma gondii ME49]EPR60050.1 SNARE protein [Toxoplasma gondii GT1]KAF4639995.1 SNARE protein [Toxoplasma gondii]KFG36099.1 SNARE protein [Toxoplasma gondii GAB2-2007-GAL-DOM2]KFG41361.1 SNARE protein [Toxoplasma gondii p89]KFG52853.1 SNARE protein [Toxoplasma gondii FOU]KFG62158.1 SNARE protein [Toxoplasma gondii RUB]KFH07972.1 SNARE protein [Toxoplasma gondii VAND]KFH16510.1 SNARE protein [Toxoplasma gondii MAS]KYK68050.1 SNARE protein [Toxoplasma gondii TgCatPRC2]|eukprot:XP_018635693.1 SNARE protein [Toxoplasma gondii ME49]